MSDSGDAYAARRERMVADQLETRGIDDLLTLQAMRQVPRHAYVPDEMAEYAYEDGPLSIGWGQTISQPYIVALMTQAAKLEPSGVVLEIGTGSGYAAAVLARIADEVYTVERIPELAERASQCYERQSVKNVHVKVANGTLGWPEKGPFDAILVTAGGPEVPEALLSQLKSGGRIVIPVGDYFSQNLVRVTKNADGSYVRESLCPVRFVPLIGEEGWPD